MDRLKTVYIRKWLIFLLLLQVLCVSAAADGGVMSVLTDGPEMILTGLDSEPGMVVLHIRCEKTNGYGDLMIFSPSRFSSFGFSRSALLFRSI